MLSLVAVVVVVVVVVLPTLYDVVLTVGVITVAPQLSVSQSTLLHSTSGHGTRQSESGQWKQQQQSRVSNLHTAFLGFLFIRLDQTPAAHSPVNI